MVDRTRFGDAQVLQVTEVERWTFPGVDLFPAVTDDILATELPKLRPEYVDAGHLVLAIHTYVVRLGDTTIVVDTGNGNDKQRPNLLAHHMFSTDYLQRLVSAGIDPNDVDAVISTHLHPDHCGWNTTWTGEKWTPTFPTARYLFAADELRASQAIAEQPREGVGADLARTFDDSVQPVLRGSSIVDDGEVIAQHGTTRVVVRSAHGHTPGHIAVEITGDDGGVLISGDVIHHPIQLLRPDLSQAGDSDPVTARRTRDDLLRRCADEGLRLFTSHFVTPGPLEVSLDETGSPVVEATLAGRRR